MADWVRDALPFVGVVALLSIAYYLERIAKALEHLNNMYERANFPDWRG